MKQKFLTKSGSTLVGIMLGLVLAGGINKISQSLWGEDVVTFLKGIVKDLKRAGAMTPCSKYVAQACTKYLASFQGRKKDVLEAGAGSGAISREIIQYIDTSSNSLDTYDLVELESDYIPSLQKQFGYYKNVEIYQADISTWKTEKKYDFIISTLPFTNMPLKTVKRTLENYKKWIKPNGYIVYVECRGSNDFRQRVERLKQFFRLSQASPVALQKLKGKQSLLENFKKEYLVESLYVARNIPPIMIYHLRISDLEQNAREGA